MIKIGIIGKSGRMGMAVAELCEPVDLAECEVAIDFSAKEALEKAFLLLIEKKIPLVSGTTGLPENFFDEVSKKIPVLHAPNFSLGVALLKKMVAEVSPHAKISSIEETHHTEKKDAPSGTALELGKILPDAEISSHRTPGVVGEHTVTLSLGNETVTLTHTAHDRKLFAEGALKAALWLLGKPPGRYNLGEVL